MASSDPKPVENNKAETKPEEPQKPTVAAGEDDEFDDFPVDGASYDFRGHAHIALLCPSHLGVRELTNAYPQNSRLATGRIRGCW